MPLCLSLHLSIRLSFLTHIHPICLHAHTPIHQIHPSIYQSVLIHRRQLNARCSNPISPLLALEHQTESESQNHASDTIQCKCPPKRQQSPKSPKSKISPSQ
ncbi:hypothetical protein DL95DRAFT_390282 [Leptodontidium sp. 2 PMI_412]|nr:hypothetical protein DL95DRAFT_390282 [Leptodontidium sp. 2 PMI_412]